MTENEKIYELTAAEQCSSPELQEDLISLVIRGIDPLAYINVCSQRILQLWHYHIAAWLISNNAVEIYMININNSHHYAKHLCFMLTFIITLTFTSEEKLQEVPLYVHPGFTLNLFCVALQIFQSNKAI